MINRDLAELYAAFVVLDENQKVLLIRRGAGHPFPDVLALPAGHVKIRETVLAAAWRELLEETGLSEAMVTLEGYVGAYTVRAQKMIVFYATTEADSHARDGAWYTVAEVERFAQQGNLAPNVADAVRDAIRIRQDAQVTTSPLRLSTAIAHACSALVSRFQRVGDSAGWNLYLNDQGIGTVATALALLVLTSSGRSSGSSLVHSSADTLIGLQCPDGGWSTRSTSKVAAIPLTESTSLALLALANILSEDHPSRRRAVAWLLANRRHDGSWGTTRHDDSGSVYATSLALRALAASGVAERDCTTSVMWLKNAQNEDGGWPVERNGPSTAAHTAHAILGLVEWDDQRESKVVRDGVRWLGAAFDSKTLWPDVSEVRLISDGQRTVSRVEFKHWSTPWATLALGEGGVSCMGREVSGAVAAVLGSQRPDGTWHHPLAPGLPPMWALHDAVVLLVTVRQQAGDAAFELMRSVERANAGTLRMASDINVLYLKEDVRRRWLPKTSYFLNVVALAWMTLHVVGARALGFLSITDIPWLLQFVLSVVASIVATLLGPFVYRMLNPLVQRALQVLSPIRRGR